MHYVFHILCHAANALTDLSKLPKLPSLGKLKAKIKQLNSSFDIFDTPWMKLLRTLLSRLHLLSHLEHEE